MKSLVMRTVTGAVTRGIMGALLGRGDGHHAGNMVYDRGLVARIEDGLAQIGERGIRQKNVFGGRGFMDGKVAFVIAWDSDLIVKTALADYAQYLTERGVTAFAPDGEKPMSTWVVVTSDTIADDPELVEWLRRGLRGVRR
jgi:TfoX/Sxy family transcriptional regulator of competence genes